MSGKNKAVEEAIEQAWNRQSATANMDRWLTVCEREKWGNFPENLTLLARVFGASWYFTRFIFFRGKDVVKYIDSTDEQDFSRDNIFLQLQQYAKADDLEDSFEKLRIIKNEIMFRIFLASLDEKVSQEQQEAALTCLAETTLQCALELLENIKNSGGEVSILAMGRMAGYEMNYGSDLDLIFLYSDVSGEDQTTLIRQVQSLMRHIAVPTPCGILYEIDMRLRPHGTSGTLISPVQYFIDYHNEKREIWERQMMTRCRPVIDRTGLAADAIDKITPAIYDQHDENQLLSEILQMRRKVQQELGNPRDKFEIKRGYGGIMDIDFLTHYLQLLYGHEHKILQTPSTRNAIRQLGKLNLLSDNQTREMLNAYDFLKRIEGVLRVRDLKSISAFPQNQEDEEVIVLARAMGFYDSDETKSTSAFMDRYSGITQKVRKCFTEVVGEID